tara:strand:- start:45 stop:1079 length:1035 start_codon:yes stop_codon:yes gene_type:complete
MPFIILLLVSALAVSAVAGYFSIVGLVAIFPAAEIAILSMGVVLEVAKLITASWLYRNWKTTNILLRVYFTSAVIILSIITSLGIFGFLSKAHLEHSVLTGDNDLLVQRIDRRIESEQRAVTDAESVISQLDQAVQTLIEYDRIRGDDGSIAVRQRQSDERLQLNSVIDQAIQRIDELSEEKIVLEQEQLAIEVEVGPIKYIAEMIYGNSDRETIDKAVQIVIILLILVFDPLAILLVVAANMSLKQRRGESIAFMSEKDLEVSEDFNLETAEEDEVEEEIAEISEIVELLKPEESVEEATEEELENPEMEITENDMQHVNRMDRRVRRKLEWLIDKRGKKEET